MSENTGGGRPRAVLYARVSTEEQARSGYSLAQQVEALRGYCEHEGYEVLEEVQDPGQSGVSLERPGLDRVRDLVAGGGVSAVIAQDRDRFSREPAYTYLLRREFEEHGAHLKSLNDRGDDSPEGQLTDGILDQLAKYERAKITERTRRGKLRKAQEGKLMAGRYPRYGFRLNARRDGYEIDEERMGLVRRIFEMIGRDGMSIREVAKTLDGEGVPTPSGGRFWDRATIRHWILDDSYRPHAFEEVRELVTPQVAAGLDPARRYGVLWWGRRAATTKQISEPTPEGRRYRKTYRYQRKPKSEQVPIPVPDSGIPQELIDAARGRIADNRAPSAAGGRFWELSGGLSRCAHCERTLRARKRTKKRRGKEYTYCYYSCPAYDSHRFEGCINSSYTNAAKLEQRVWEFVRDLILDPAQLREDLERMIELERGEARGKPEREAKHWLEKLAEADGMRRRYQELFAKGRMSLGELDEALSGLEGTTEHAKRELALLEDRKERIEQLEGDRDALLDYYAQLTPEALDSLTHEERHQFYKMLRLKVLVFKDGSLEIEVAAGPAREPARTPAGGKTFFQSGGHMEVCPHGRPIVRRIRLSDLLREFGR